MFKKIFAKSPFFLLLIILGLGLRFYGLFTEAQPYDIATYQAWGMHLLRVGPVHFFETIWSDYLPLPILTFALPELITKNLSLPFSLTFKAFNTLIELALIYAISSTFAKQRSRLLVLFILLLSPVTISNTSFWGQVDALPTLLALLSLCLIYNSNSQKSHIILSSLTYGLAVAYKPIMLLLAPILYIASLKKGSAWWQFPGLSATIFFATALPFVSSPPQVFAFMWERALNQADTYPYLSINAWNIWAIHANAAWIPDNLSVLGITGQQLGLTIFFLLTTLILNVWRQSSFSLKHVFTLSSLILIIFFTFTTRMHERHLLFGLPFLAISLLITPQKLFYYLALSSLYLLNLVSAFSWVKNNQTWPLPPHVTSLSSYSLVILTLTLTTTYLKPHIFQKTFAFIKTHRTFLLIVLFASLLRLVNLAHPQAYIFDEVYHAFTAKEYLHNHIEAWEWWTTPPEGVAYEWTHPPVAKYGMVLGMLLLGEHELGYRLGSAVMGILAVIGLYGLVKALTQNNNLALLTAFLLAIEGTHLAQSRIAMNDSYLLTFLIWALYAAVSSRWKVASILYGLALGSKWSALYGLVPLAFIYLHHHPLSTWKKTLLFTNILSIIRYLLIAIVVYVLSFAPFITSGHTWQQWWELHRQMWYYHTNLVATHAYQSTPLEWIMGARPVWYWVEYGQGVISNIYVQGNPLLLWTGLFALLIQLPRLFVYPLSLYYLLYFVFTLPWLFSPRIMFYYHYLPSIAFLLPLLSTYLLTLPKKTLLIYLSLALLSLLFISPMLYGYPLPQQYWDTYFSIFPSWK